jgi:hypothetical protein
MYTQAIPAPTAGVHSNGQAPPSGATSTASASPPARPPWPITGQNAAKGRRSRQQRVKLAEFLIAGSVVLVRPTAKQAAALARVPVAEIYRARRARKSKPTPPSLVEHIAMCSPIERIEAARQYGVDRIWDEMLVPNLGARRGVAR